MGLFWRIVICIVCCGTLLLTLIHQHNRVTALQLDIPQLKQRVRDLESENLSLQFQVARSETPVQLLEWAKDPRFAHLTFPQQDDISVLP